MRNPKAITELFNIKYPIVQGGMVWHSGWRLAAAVSNAGGLGLLGAGSMYPKVLRVHIQKCKQATNKPFGVNLPLLYPNIEEHLQIIEDEKIPVVFTSAGNPKLYTQRLQALGAKVAHVVSSTKFAIKSNDAGVDAIVAEGFEAGGHNGRDETTTMVLIPSIRQHLSSPLIAAGGIAFGSQIKAAFALGADGVQMGTRFAAAQESSAHENWKQCILSLNEGDTILTLKELAPVRLVKNALYQKIEEAYSSGKNIEAIKEILGKGKAKLGMFEGDLQNGELEIGQASVMMNKIQTVEEIFNEIIEEFNAIHEVTL